jgi:DNA-binding CsgD family transcriptional regulator
VLKLARKGMTSSEISRRMRISQDQVEFIIRLRREKG